MAAAAETFINVHLADLLRAQSPIIHIRTAK